MTHVLAPLMLLRGPRDAPSLNEGRVPHVSLDAPKDMLTQWLHEVALGQLECRILYEYTPPSRSNATRQAPLIAEARNERRLLTVACKRLLGQSVPCGWGAIFPTGFCTVSYLASPSCQTL